jgi:hypothetical protein
MDLIKDKFYMYSQVDTLMYILAGVAIKITIELWIQ